MIVKVAILLEEIMTWELQRQSFLLSTHLHWRVKESSKKRIISCLQKQLEETMLFCRIQPTSCRQPSQKRFLWSNSLTYKNCLSLNHPFLGLSHKKRSFATIPAIIQVPSTGQKRTTCWASGYHAWDLLDEEMKEKAAGTYWHGTLRFRFEVTYLK